MGYVLVDLEDSVSLALPPSEMVSIILFIDRKYATHPRNKMNNTVPNLLIHWEEPSRGYHGFIGFEPVDPCMLSDHGACETIVYLCGPYSVSGGPGNRERVHVLGMETRC